MKKLLILTVCLLPLFASAQGSRLKGGKLFQLGGGFRGSGPYLGMYGGMNFNNLMKGLFGGGVGRGRFGDVNYSYLFVDGIASFAVSEINRMFYFSGQAGLCLNADVMSKFESADYSKRVNMNYGVIGGVEAEFYASRSVIFVLTAHQRYFIKEDFGRWRYQLGAGIRFIVY